MEVNEYKRLSGKERLFLIIPLMGGLFFGVGLLVFPFQLAQILHYSGSDELVYQLAGAATFGYAVALWNIIKRATWREGKFVIMGTFLFNLVSLYACIIEILSHTQQPVVYVILVTSIIIMLITGRLLLKYKLTPVGKPTVRDASIILLGLFTLAGVTLGVLLLFPVVTAKLFGLVGADFFIYRQAGAAVLGYSLIAVMQMRSRRFDEMDLPLLMAVTFTGLTFAAGSYQLINDNISPFTYSIVGGSGFGSLIFLWILFKESKRVA